MRAAPVFTSEPVTESSYEYISDVFPDWPG